MSDPRTIDADRKPSLARHLVSPLELEFVDMPEEIRFAQASGMTFVVTVAHERFGEKRAIVTGCS